MTNLASISWLQATWITDQNKIINYEIGIAIIIGIIIGLICHQMWRRSPEFAFYLTFGIPLISLLISLPITETLANVSNGDICQVKQAKIVKVVHIKSTQNYIAYDKNGKQHNVDKEDTDINTSKKSSAKLMYVAPKPGISKEVFDKYINDSTEDDKLLEINLAPSMKNTKMEVWNFE